MGYPSRMTGQELERSGRNFLGILEGEDDYRSFIRFTGEQIRLFDRNPLFRNLSLCSSGVYLALVTDGDSLILDCRTLEITGMILPALAEIGWDGLKDIIKSLSKKLEQRATFPRSRDRFDLVTDDGQLVSRMPKGGRIRFGFRNEEHRKMGLRLYFPVFPYVAVRHLESNGNLMPDQARAPRILCLGDSIMQGFNAGHPSRTYVARLALGLGVEALNQGVGGFYFDAESLSGLEGIERPSLIMVAYGTNDWDLCQDYDALRDGIAAFFARLAVLFPGIPTYVVTPIWRGDIDERKKCGTFLDVADTIAREAAKYPDNRIVNGLDIPIRERKYFEDNWLHPNEAGFAIMADYLYGAIGKG